MKKALEIKIREFNKIMDSRNLHAEDLGGIVEIYKAGKVIYSCPTEDQEEYVIGNLQGWINFIRLGA